MAVVPLVAVEAPWGSPCLAVADAGLALGGVLATAIGWSSGDGVLDLSPDTDPSCWMCPDLDLEAAVMLSKVLVVSHNRKGML